ncbi:hypothetical protein [Bacillus sp. X1(2014)]|uniref:hypothetical protein n=1 Tax=Bacillus sp. X1(2014) TaxID=1565991 RepID=UPI0021B2D74D|nr:hypothetical protein [Bacillus sp. X1(2014)]
MLKVNVEFGTLLIFVPGTKTPAGGRGRGDPAGAQRRGGSPDRPRKAKCLERKSTGKFNRAFDKSGRNYQLKTQEISIEIITTLVYDKGDL